MKRFPLYLALLISLLLSAFSFKDPALEYINTFSVIAVKEMNRSGIPASIKLAQALLESECGRSPLAINANNHFGIKCGKNWDGQTFFKTDDDLDSTGMLIESCFRSFPSAEESFIAHTEFLTDPKKVNRYGFLFELEKSDYVSWAQGLKNAGYATDQTYPDKLIRLIEKYQLTKYDEHYHPEKPLAEVDKTSTKEKMAEKQGTSRLLKPERKTAPDLKNIMLKVIYVNEVRSVKLPIDLTADQIATVLKYDVVNLLSYNENIISSATLLPKGSVVNLEEKRKDYHGKEKFHVVQDGETMETISNQYGIKARSLYILNKIPAQCQPIPGEKISLKEKVSKHHKPKYKRNLQKKEEYLF